MSAFQASSGSQNYAHFTEKVTRAQRHLLTVTVSQADLETEIRSLGFQPPLTDTPDGTCDLLLPIWWVLGKSAGEQ